jgi:hypothetical protein
MVDVPDVAREAELRAGLRPDLPFADLVREVHQDEIERAFSQPSQLAFLTGLVAAQEIGDAVTIARHHRLHDLSKARRDLRPLCALMRLVDELDIGWKRAPLPVYQALRTRMGPIEKFHWLKHLCTRPIERDITFLVETRGDHRTLKVFVGVEATEGTWQPLQAEILRKVQKCLVQEGVNSVLREFLQAEIEVEPGSEEISKASPWLSAEVREDLEALLQWGYFDQNGSESRSEKKHSSVEAVPRRVSIHPPAPDGQLATPLRVSDPQEREFKILAIPPEDLGETLCRFGRLTVIGNRYVRPTLESIGGIPGAFSRIYLGPADCGKTRAAYEWIHKLTDGCENRWVVLRTDMGTIPENVERIVLDTSLYEQKQYQVPSNAILFLDDLPLNLPPPRLEMSPTDALRRLLEWFRKLPYFRVRRVVGTIRLEDLHTRPGWPDVLPSLGEELEILRLQPLDPEGYRKLWEGMGSGAIATSVTKGVEPFQLGMDHAFLGAVVNRPAEPEAVAVFIQQAATRERRNLEVGDAASFSDSAVQTWLNETWPTLYETYGPAARVFFTLARFLEAGLRPSSGFRTSLEPLWEFHSVLGPELLSPLGGAGEDYLPSLRRMYRDGHAAGKDNEWIRPRMDFLLQAESLTGVEIPLSPLDFIETFRRLTASSRRYIAQHLAAGGVAMTDTAHEDMDWQGGWGVGLGIRSDTEKDVTQRLMLLDQSIVTLKAIAQADPKSEWTSYNLGQSLKRRAMLENDPLRRTDLQEQEIQAYQKAVATLPNDANAWFNLGFSLGQKVGRIADVALKSQLLEQQIQAYQQGVAIQPDHADAWFNLGHSLEQRAELEADPAQKAQFQEQGIQAYQKAVAAQPGHASAWFNLGGIIWQKAKREADPAQKVQLQEQEILAYRKAVAAQPGHASAWFCLGYSFWQKAGREADPDRKAELQEQEIQAYQKAVAAQPDYADAWFYLGVSLGQKAEREADPDRKAELQEQEIQAYQKALTSQPGQPKSFNLELQLLQRAAQENDSNRKARFLNQALEAATQAARLGAGRYNLACALALNHRIDEALQELEGCLDREEISPEHVAEDPDWTVLHSNPRFQALLSRRNPSPSPPIFPDPETPQP